MPTYLLASGGFLGRKRFARVEHAEAALRVYFDDLAVRAGPDEAVELGNLRGDVERLLGDSATRRRAGDVERGAVVDAAGDGPRRRGEHRTAADSSEELARLDVADAWRRVAETDGHVDTHMG